MNPKYTKIIYPSDAEYIMLGVCNYCSSIDRVRLAGDCYRHRRSIIININNGGKLADYAV